VRCNSCRRVSHKDFQCFLTARAKEVKVTTPSGTECSYCNKPRHFARKCWKNKRRNYIYIYIRGTWIVALQTGGTERLRWKQAVTARCLPRQTTAVRQPPFVTHMTLGKIRTLNLLVYGHSRSSNVTCRVKIRLKDRECWFSPCRGEWQQCRWKCWYVTEGSEVRDTDIAGNACSEGGKSNVVAS
jgi:hypothetical protein